MADFAAVRGLRIDLATGQGSLLLARPSAMAPPLFSLEAGSGPKLMNIDELEKGLRGNPKRRTK